jgi:two-component system, NtrC family, response regulator GlrR
MRTELVGVFKFSSQSNETGRGNPDQRKFATSEMQGQGKGERILVVDDTPSWLWIARKILSAAGYQVQVCENSSDALSLLSQDPSQIDLVITDLNMPGLDGFELAAALLKINASLPVVLTSAERVEMTPAKLQTMGIRGFVTKPWQRERLFSTIQQALAHAGSDKTP